MSARGSNRSAVLCFILAATSCAPRSDLSTAPPETKEPEVESPEVVEATAATAPAAPAHEVSVRPGINDSWRGKDIAPLIANLEAEDREIVQFKAAIVRATGVRPGEQVADVGSGSGLLTVELARATGAKGTVFAVDINELLLERVAARAREAGLENVKTTFSPDDAVPLPAESIDVVFVCDTYHHFEYPKTVLRGLFRALRPGGRLVVVDFERIEGTSEAWVLEHVRAPKEVVVAEIEAAGFRVRERPTIEGMSKNYLIVFERP